VTRPDLFRRYFTQQIGLLLENHGAPIEIGESHEPIPIQFAYRRDINSEARTLLAEPRNLLQDIFDTPDLATIDDAIVNGTVLAVYTTQITEPGAATAMLNWYRAIRLRNSRMLNLAQVIDVPTLVVWGERDVALDPICLDGTERCVRDLRVKQLPGVSHWVQQDAPRVVNELLQEFLA
jgi:pimeloyl-ACP methyl ester carboxylesterase